MKILITSDWYKPVINGVVTSINSLEAGLTALGHEVRILTLSNRMHSYTEGNVTYIGSISAGLVYPNARLRTALGSAQIRELIEWKPDVVHSQCEFSTFFMAKKIAHAADCPLVHTYHTVYEDFTHYFSPSERLGRWVSAVLSRKFMKRVDAVIVPTGKIRALLLRYGVTQPISVVPSGLELEHLDIPFSEEERLTMRRGLGIPDDTFVLLFLGRLAKEKNVEELFVRLQELQAGCCRAQETACDGAEKPADAPAAAASPGAVPDPSRIRLLLVGDGPYRPQLEAKAKELGLADRVIFAGMVKPAETPRYYRLGDLFLSASRSETQGLTYIEAMACGLPLLCHYDDCLEELIENGKNGLTYETDEEFRAGFARLAGDPACRAAMGEAARETIRQNYSSIAFAEHALQVYREEIGRLGQA